jgi:uncharacterized protein DUF4253
VTREEAEQEVLQEQQDPEGSRHFRSGWDWPDDPTRRTLDATPSLAASESAVTMALVPVTHGWQIPEAFGYGSYNNYLTPYEHTAILRYWNHKWGADLFAFTGTQAQFVVSRPPTSRDDAFDLAIEWTAYNDDQCNAYGPMELAASLLGATAWFAWWD